MRPPERAVSILKLFFEMSWSHGRKEFRMTEYLVPDFSTKCQIFFCPLSLTIFFCVMRSNYGGLSLYFLTPNLSQVFWLISWELCLIWDCFPLFSCSPVTVWNLEHPHTRPWLSPYATQKTLWNVLSKLGRHLDRDSFSHSGKSKYETKAHFQFFNARINFRVISFSVFFPYLT